MRGYLGAWTQSALIFGSALALAVAFRLFVDPFLQRLAKASKGPVDDMAYESISLYLLPWILMAGAALALPFSPLGAESSVWVQKGLLAAFLLSASLAVAGLGSRALEHYGAELGLELGSMSLTRTLLRTVMAGLGLLLVLSNLGVSITPLLTALGVGSLAVALALQDTLSNLFAGFHVILNRQIRVGDYLRLEGGQEGYVSDIGWRNCRIRELAGNVILVPNTKLSQLIVTNFNQPAKDLAVLVQMGVAYGSDLDKVERVTVEVASQVMREVEGAARDFQPFIRFHTFAESSINFTVILRATEFVHRFLVTHEFIKRVKARYTAEGIEIPFPQRVLSLNHFPGAAA